MADVKLTAIIKKVTTTLKDDKDPETKEIIGHHLETGVALLVTDLDDESLRMLAALQSDGELVVEVTRRQGALFKPAAKKTAAEAH